jgi:hypothetical protein
VHRAIVVELAVGELPIPQRPGVECLAALGGDLPVQTGIGLQEPLVGWLASSARSTYSSWSSKFWVTAEVSTRSSAKPPPASRTAIQAAAITIIRRVSEPVLAIRPLLFTSSCVGTMLVPCCSAGKRESGRAA